MYGSFLSMMQSQIPFPEPPKQETETIPTIKVLPEEPKIDVNLQSIKEEKKTEEIVPSEPLVLDSFDFTEFNGIFFYCRYLTFYRNDS